MGTKTFFKADVMSFWTSVAIIVCIFVITSEPNAITNILNAIAKSFLHT